ncbi:malate dehydrogenase [Candidatus Acetothermia bacterium]|jgi:malate dehydrogenase|nr:malate dehydrogenase [Candidatus Acetothermia bacterium]MCI2432263.1 malate dehydrogenase [Candidatus Acetothermia bacterium]MCI2436519.1 malate dehydrogenase [Candidatus Acetothermia bacterium]
MRPKVSIIGAGATGATMAQRLVEKNLCNVVMLDIPERENPTKGKALDMLQAGPLAGFSSRVIGTSDYKEIANSQIVVITAGIPRKPGMTREDLINTNTKIVRSCAEQAAKHSLNAVLIIFSNPLDAMVHVAHKVTQFPRERVIGQGGALDSARWRTFIALELGVSPEDVQGLVLGGHTDVGMVPLPRYSSVAGIPLTDLLDSERIAKIVDRARKGGTEIVQLLGEGSAYYAPSAAVIEMIESILLDQKRIIPSSVLLQGEYGLRDVFLGVPVVLGARGAEKIIELKLNKDELAQLHKAAEIVRETVSKVQL